MDREKLHAWLLLVMGDMLNLAGISTEDTPEGAGFILDAVAEVYAAQPSLSPMYANDLAAWFALQRIQPAMLSLGGKLTVDGDTFDLTATLDGINKWITRLRSRLGWIVEPVETSDPDSEIGKVVTVFQPWTNNGLGGTEW